IYENKSDGLYLIVIPDLNWSIEIESSLNEDDIKEELVIHLFTLLDESTAEQIADVIGEWIFENERREQMRMKHEVESRKTFAIISHPDAGKTTLTEKLLLFGGAIREAGTVKGKKSGKFATSDWMKVEQERGISVTSSVMQFDYDHYKINILDTPG